jgi:ABC-type phosphate transport system substrate-binding protein
MSNPGRVIASLLLGAATLFGSASAGDGFRVIVNAGNPATALRAVELSRLFLKKTVDWPDGTPAAPVDQARTSSVRRLFSQKVHGKDADAVVSHWQTMVFSGREVPPPIKTSDAAVVEFVRANPGAIGYVSDSVELAGVKVVAVR